MTTSTYDLCLLVTTTKDRRLFGIVGIQTDDTLIVISKDFNDLEEQELRKANLKAKPKEMLSTEDPLIFNGYIIRQNSNTVELRQKEQGKKLKAVKFIDTTKSKPDSTKSKPNTIELNVK